MKAATKMISILLAAVLLLTLFAGCSDTTGAGEPTNPSQPAGSNTSEEWEPVSTVPEFEKWLNAKLTELGYPLKVTFLAPEEDGYVKGEMSYTGSGEDIYTAYLYFYVYLKEDLETIDYAVVSARENCPDEVLAAHKKLALELSLHFDPNIQEATVDAIFDVLPDSETEYYVDPETGIGVSASDRNYQALFETAFCSHELRKEIKTGHIWYFVYKKYVSPSTTPAILEVQNLINEAFQDLGQPLEIIFIDFPNATCSYLHYRGNGQPSCHPHEQMQIELSTSEDGAITWLDITIPHTAQEIYEDIQKELAIRLCAHFFSSVPQSDVELMFDINANWDQYQQEQRGNLYIYPHDYYLYYDISEDANFRLLSDPNRDGQSFILTIPPIGGSNTPADKPVLEYPLTYDAFFDALEYALPEWAVVDVLEYVHPEGMVTVANSGTLGEASALLQDRYGNSIKIDTRVRVHDHVIKSAYIYPMAGGFSDPNELMKDIIPKINSLFDPDADEETFRAFYEENYLTAEDANPVTFTSDNFEGKLSKTSVGLPSVTYTFQLDPSANPDENYFVATGLMQAPSTADGRFSFPAQDPEESFVFYCIDFENCLNAYLYDMGVPFELLQVGCSESYKDVSNGTASPNMIQYGYEIDTPYGQRLTTYFIVEDYMTPTPEDLEIFQFQYYRDMMSLFSFGVERDKFLDQFYSDAATNDFGYNSVEEAFVHIPIALSMFCDDGMTEKEAKALFSDTYEPIKTSGGALYVIYAPRDVVHVLREDPETGNIVYTVLTKADYEKAPAVTKDGEILYTVGG